MSVTSNVWYLGDLLIPIRGYLDTASCTPHTASPVVHASCEVIMDAWGVLYAIPRDDQEPGEVFFH
jgi:hypothetical protein